MHDSAKYFTRVMDRLWADEDCRSFVVFPLCFRQDGSDFSIVFPRLSDYRIGLPSDDSLRSQFIAKLEIVMHSLHHAGVVHLDWYLSNFMWKCDDTSGEVIIKVIDFDSAQIISDGASQGVLKRLSGRRAELAGREVGGRSDLRNFDISLMNVLKKFSESEPKLQSLNKPELDECFRALQLREVGYQT
jgi:serine/threonine protein kinase